MGLRRGLIDSNVLVAAATVEHIHYDNSQRLLNSDGARNFATSIHCLSECYNGLTRIAGKGPAVLLPVQAMSTILTYVELFEVLELGINPHIEALRRFAALEGRGPLVYDFLIGQVAVTHSIPLIVTWNVRHFAPLFPQLRVVTPAAFIQEP